MTTGYRQLKSHPTVYSKDFAFLLIIVQARSIYFMEKHGQDLRWNVYCKTFKCREI